jgi:hypothetical protein
MHPRLGVVRLHPYPKQQEFLDYAEEPEAKVIGWDGPNRVGKTVAAAMSIVSMAVGIPVEEWPDLPDETPASLMSTRRTQQGCVTVSREKSRDVQQAAIAELLPSHWIAGRQWTKKTGFGVTTPKVVLRNGSSIDFMSDLQRHQTLEGFRWHKAWIDEAIDEWVYERLIARLIDTAGKMLITAIPEKAWLHRVLRMRLLTRESNEPAPAELIRVIEESSMFDNEGLDLREIKKAIKMWGGLDSKMTRMRVLGQYTHLEGADPGYDNPFAWLFMAIDPSGFKHLIDEIYVRRMLVPDLANLIKERRTRLGYSEPQWTVIDPAAKQKKFWGRTVISIRQTLMECGISTVEADNSPGSRDAGYERIRQEFSADRLGVGKDLKWTRFELLHHRHQDVDVETGEHLGRDKYVDAHNHLIAALRYMLAMRPTWIPVTMKAAAPGTVAADLQRFERERVRRGKSVWK